MGTAGRDVSLWIEMIVMGLRTSGSVFTILASEADILEEFVGDGEVVVVA